MGKEKRSGTRSEDRRAKWGAWLSLPVEAVLDLPHVEMSGNREILLENCRGLIGYDEQEVRVSGGRCIIRITGQGLTLRNLRSESLLISGEITAVEFIG
ncbi:MAG: YabP/YqfC family sporulation protein [Eubacteriales bacterium]